MEISTSTDGNTRIPNSFVNLIFMNTLDTVLVTINRAALKELMFLSQSSKYLFWMITESGKQWYFSSLWFIP